MRVAACAVLVLLLNAFFWEAGLSQTAPPNLLGVSGAYEVGPGDVVEIAVFEVEELSRTVVVNPDGTISLPLIGEVVVRGFTTAEIETTLKALYGRDLLRDPQISVRVEEFRSQPASVLGGVRDPGVYQLQGRRRLLDVLAMAGGLSPEVGETITISRDREELARDDPAQAQAKGSLASNRSSSRAPLKPGRRAQEVRVSVRDLLTLQPGESNNPLIEPYDVIHVAKAGVVYVLGAVKKPGGFSVKDQERVTILRAISLAGGLERHSAPQGSRVIRQDGGARKEIPVRVGKVLRGKAADLELQPNDILFIPDSRAKTALSRGAEAIVQMATGIVIWRR